MSESTPPRTARCSLPIFGFRAFLEKILSSLGLSDTNVYECQVRALLGPATYLFRVSGAGLFLSLAACGKPCGVVLRRSYLTESVYKVVLHRSISTLIRYSFFTIVIINDNLTDLWGRRLLQIDFINTFCEIRSTPPREVPPPKIRVVLSVICLSALSAGS